jgi:hypothetical protein
MPIITKSTVNQDASADWILRPEREYFTHDELIDAYLRGKEKQKNDNQKILLEKLGKNVKHAQSIVETITAKINQKGFKSFKSYLRINNIIKFDAIFDVSMLDFTSNKFDDIYTLSRKIKKEKNNDTFNINFTFMPHSDNLNEKRLVCEGFIFMYEKRG